MAAASRHAIPDRPRVGDEGHGGRRARDRSTTLVADRAAGTARAKESVPAGMVPAGMLTASGPAIRAYAQVRYATRVTVRTVSRSRPFSVRVMLPRSA